MANSAKYVIINGAGFSAPARLPIQNRIIDKMTEDPDSLDFMANRVPQESIRFLNAYVTVGIFLLDNFGKSSYKNLSKEYYRLNNIIYSLDVLSSSGTQNARINDSISNIRQAIFFNNENYLPLLYDLKRRIRLALQRESVQVDLEDIFTSFDKAVLSHEHMRKYSYAQMDEIRYSIMRLFIYYFSKCVIDHETNQDDYLNFVNYLYEIKKISTATIITTNWDTLAESYLKKYRINYSYGFRSPYTSADSSISDDLCDVLLLKIHGSANWLKCLHCGSISVFDDNDAAESLFDDYKQEKCAFCTQDAPFSSNSLQPEIITPTMLKSLSSRIYFNLWGAAGSEIRAASHIIFVGYSLPVADFDFRYLLQKNVSPRAKIDVVLWKDDDPTQTDKERLRSLLPEKRYRDTFPKNKLRFYYGGFKEYFAHASDSRSIASILTSSK